MPFIECIIPSCRKTIYDETLYNFPSNETLQKEWLKRVAPHCPKVLELSSQQLRSRKVCMRHFERKFLTGQKRLHSACPTLITEEEIAQATSTMPMDIKAETDHTYLKSLASEHTYCKRPLCKPYSLQASKIKKNINQALIDVVESALSSTSTQNLPKLARSCPELQVLEKNAERNPALNFEENKNAIKKMCIFII